MVIEQEPPIIEYQDGDDTTEGLGNEDGSLVVVHSLIAQNLK